MSFLKKIRGDVRAYFVGLIMTGIIAILSPVGAALWKAYSKEDIPWTIFIVVVCVGIVLVVVAIRLTKKFPVLTEERLRQDQRNQGIAVERKIGPKVIPPRKEAPPKTEQTALERHEAWEKEQATKGIMVHLPRAGEIPNRTVTAEVRSSICGKINELIKGGETLLLRMQIGGGYDGIGGQFDQWSQRCDEYLRDSLGADAIKLFHSPAAVLHNPMRMSSVMMGEPWNYQGHLYERISSRIPRLGEIVRKVERGEIEPC